MDRGQLAGDDGIEGAKDVQFPIVIRGRITKDGDLNIHFNHCSSNWGWSLPEVPRWSTNERGFQFATSKLRISPGSHCAVSSKGRQQTSQSTVNLWSGTVVSTPISMVC